jgi:ribosomal protein L7/L12
MIIRLIDTGSSKLHVVKLVKDLCKMGLAESKDIVDSAPSVFEISDEFDFMAVQKEFEDIGAKVELVNLKDISSQNVIINVNSTNNISSYIQTIKITKIEQKNSKVRKIIKKYSVFDFSKTLNALNNLPFTFIINTYKNSLIEFKYEAKANNIEFEIIEPQTPSQVTPIYTQKTQIENNVENINLKITIIFVTSKLEFIKNFKEYFVAGLTEAKELTDFPNTIFYCTIPANLLTKLHQHLSIKNTKIEIEQVQELNIKFPFFELKK